MTAEDNDTTTATADVRSVRAGATPWPQGVRPRAVRTCAPLGEALAVGGYAAHRRAKRAGAATSPANCERRYCLTTTAHGRKRQADSKTDKGNNDGERPQRHERR